MKPVSIDDILAKPQIYVDVYIQLNESKYICVAKAGSQTPSESLAKYKNRKVQYLFVKGEDYMKLVAHSISVAGMVVGTNKFSDVSKLAVIDEAATAVFRELQVLGLNSQVVAHAKLVNEATMALVQSNPNIAPIVEKFATLGPNEARHNLFVSVMATLIGVGHNWIKPATLEKLALGGLLHDLGKTKMPKEIAAKPHSKMSHDEKVIYQSHPDIGRQMLTVTREVPDDVILIVYEHHEMADGSGYPRGIKDFQISPLARVVCLANAFVESVEQYKGTPTPNVAKKVLDDFEFSKSHMYNKEAVKVLRRLVETDMKRLAG